MKLVKKQSRINGLPSISQYLDISISNYPADRIYISFQFTPSTSFPRRREYVSYNLYLFKSYKTHGIYIQNLVHANLNVARFITINYNESMSLKLFNSLSKSKEDFKPYSPPNVNFYTCGFTVYDHTHIGSIKKYVGDDLIRRSLDFLGYKVIHVQNVTDVGHLVSDNDEGEDKLEKGAKKHNKSVWDVAEEFMNEFYNTMDAVNNLRPTIIQRATDEKSIKSQILKIQTLIDNGFGYITENAVYFDVSKLSEYNPFSNQTLEQKIKGAREDVVIDKNKKNPADFALWVFTKGIHKDHIMRWESPWGNGFPGWHIECSAISLDNLDNKIDIHTGGVDHKEIHHPNEIAQNVGICGHQVVKFWVHHEFLVVDGKKMSKSLGNFYTLNDIQQKGYSALELRYFMLQAHYRSQINFTWQALENAANGYKNLKRKVAELQTSLSSHSGVKSSLTRRAIESNESNIQNLDQYKNFASALQDDINIPQALAVVWETVDNQQLSDEVKLSLVKLFDEVMGLKLLENSGDKIPENIQQLAQKRQTAREQKDFDLADKLRQQISDEGYEVEDTSNGFKLLKK